MCVYIYIYIYTQTHDRGPGPGRGASRVALPDLGGLGLAGPSWEVVFSKRIVMGISYCNYQSSTRNYSCPGGCPGPGVAPRRIRGLVFVLLFFRALDSMREVPRRRAFRVVCWPRLSLVCLTNGPDLRTRDRVAGEETASDESKRKNGTRHRQRG